MVVEVDEARTSGEIDLAMDLAESVWGARPIAGPMLRALELAGSYVAVARDGDDLVGVCAGFVGIHGSELHLHSHLAAVIPEARGRGIGRALKRHQRTWCLDHGIETVTWTFDPLVRENARFNLHRLGATGDRYLVDLYGAMDDDINHGQPSDRLLVRWDLGGPEAVLALDTPLPVSSDDHWLRQGAAVAVSSVDGWPVVEEAAGDMRLVATPPSIVQLRATDRAAALEWRLAVRAAMTAAFDDGFRPVAVTADGSYLLVRTGDAGRKATG